MDKELARITGERREKVGMRKVFLADRTWVKTRGGRNILYQIYNK